jgi:alpha-1,2-mannosyltransferase
VYLSQAYLISVSVPGFLPSSFSMYAVTLSSALILLEKYAAAVSVAAAGVILG